MNKKFLIYIHQNRKKIAIFVVTLFFLVALCIAFISTKMAITPATKSNTIINVSGDGSGDFNCNGSDDQVEINKAIEDIAENPQFTTVYLKGPNTYVISDSILIGSNTVLEGDSTAVIKLVDDAGWPAMKPLIQQMDSRGNNNITIKGFEVNGNYPGNYEISLGRGYYNIMYFNNCKNVTVSNMDMHHGMGDGLRIENSSDIQFYHNEVYKLGHDGFYAINCSKIEAWNNRITIRTNSGLRAWNSNHVEFHDNMIDSFYDWSAGNAGIQIEKSNGVVNDVDIYNNTIHDTYGPGIWLIGYGEDYPKEEAKDVHIHNNIFYNTGTNPSIDCVGGIVTSGFYDTLIENNVFDGVYHAAITNLYPLITTGVDAGSDDSPKGNDYTTKVRNNIIVNTQIHKKDSNETGYGVINYFPGTSNFVLENNCLYNNTGGNYINANSTSDIYVDPLFVDQLNHDYHLKSNSPCICAGYSSSGHSIKLESKGTKINIGRYD